MDQVLAFHHATVKLWPVTKPSHQQSRMPTYGIDAPNVVRGFFGGGAVLAAAGILGLVALDHPVRPFAWLLLLVSAVMLALGLSMLLYALVGKQRLRDHLLSHRTWRGDEVVLDLGAGRGLMAVGAAHRAPMGRVIALDLWSAKDLSGNTPEALEANATLERVGHRIEIVTGDARRLGLADASVDVVVSVFCIHNIEPAVARAEVCQEISRVLKPDGIAMIADFPGTGGYVEAFGAAGLRVAGPFRAEPIAFGIAGYLIATK